MLAWLGYMKHGEPQERVLGLKMYPPNLKPDFEEQARSFVDGVLDQVGRPPLTPVLRGDSGDGHGVRPNVVPSSTGKTLRRSEFSRIGALREQCPDEKECDACPR